MKIVLERPANAYDMFELISADVKSNPLNPDPEKGKPVPPSPEEVSSFYRPPWRRASLTPPPKHTNTNARQQVAKQLQWAKRCASLLKVPEEPVELPVTIPDLVDEANLLEWAGISFGKGDVYRLYLSVKKLAETLPGDMGRLRLFGKISTRSSPYYIVEGLSDGDPEGVDPTKQEGKEGANKYVYWVAQSVEATSGWVKLPHVTSDEVVTSRKFKRLLTGNLDAAVPAYPPFNGTEKNLLRAIIARIAGSTLVSPGESRPRRIHRLPFPLPLPPPNPHAPFHSLHNTLRRLLCRGGGGGQARRLRGNQRELSQGRSGSQQCRCLEAPRSGAQQAWPCQEDARAARRQWRPHRPRRGGGGDAKPQRLDTRGVDVPRRPWWRWFCSRLVRRSPLARVAGGRRRRVWETVRQLLRGQRR